MSQTFGAATGDDITVSGHLNSNVSGHIFMGWYYPTTLTNGRVYWGASSLVRIGIGATVSSEIFVDIDRTTTDSRWTTSGAAIVVNEWVFIAIVKNSNSGAANFRCWVGHGCNAPQEVSISETTVGSGTEVAASNAVVGNQSSAATVAFQGDIGQVLDERFSPSAVAPMAIETIGTITQAEADYFLQTAIIPYWQGRPKQALSRGTNTALYLFDCEEVKPILWIDERGTAQRIGPEELTVNGATPSQGRQAMGIMQSFPQRVNQRCRRR